MFDYPKFIITLLLIFSSTSSFAVDVTVNNAWIREAPPVSQVQAAYAVINNNQENDIQLISANSSAYKKIEFHQTVLENGVNKMLHQPSITIPHNSHVTLKPEGMHMMLFNPVKPLQAGEEVTITFEFSDNSTTTQNFLVKKSTGTNSHHHMHH